MANLWPIGPAGPPLYLGILNATPDSFSDGGRFLTADAALVQARTLLEQGVRMLDLGGESTRPQAKAVTPGQEWARLEPVLARLRAELPEVPISLDTRHPEVAAQGLRAGVAVLNDVTGFQDPAMLELARQSGCGLIAMRSRQDGHGLQMPPYDQPGATRADAAIEELAVVKERLRAAGIPRERILLDPGFGFGMPFSEDNALWEALPRLPQALDWPAEAFCIGVSRKRLLAVQAGTPQLLADERDLLTARAHHWATAHGYRVFRSHVGGQPRLRPALAGDAEALAQVQMRSWRSAYREVLPAAVLDQLQAPPLARSFRAMAEAEPPGRLWVMDWGGKLCGYAATGPSVEPGPDPDAEVYAIYTLKESWGLGLGQTLLARALADLREQGFHHAVLWVLERNARARRFYEAGGWSPWGTPRTVWHGGIALRELQYRIGLT
jgi:dihydropteroate synthase